MSKVFVLVPYPETAPEEEMGQYTYFFALEIPLDENGQGPEAVWTYLDEALKAMNQEEAHCGYLHWDEVEQAGYSSDQPIDFVYPDIPDPLPPLRRFTLIPVEQLPQVMI